MSTFRKVTLGLAAAATIGVSTLAAMSPAEAQYRRGVRGGAIAAGVIGGLALGAAAAAASRPGYYYGPGYGYAPAYGAYGGCWREPQVVGYDRWGREVIRNVRVCN